MKNRYFAITRNNNGTYNIEIQKMNNGDTLIYSNVDSDITTEMSYILTGIGYSKRIKHINN